MPVIFEKPDDLIGKEGTVPAATEWLAFEQDRVDEFAEVTCGHQWIHVDVERAKTGPFGAPLRSLPPSSSGADQRVLTLKHEKTGRE